MNTSKLLTTSVAALAVVGAGLVYAQATPGGTAAPASPDQATPTQAQPGMPATGGTGTAPMPNQDTTQRSTTMPMTPDARADRN